jgi:levanbiose-producing levanase
VYEGKVMLLSGYAVGLVFRSSADGASSYAVILDTVQGFKISSYSPHTKLDSYPVAVEYNHWYTIKVVVDGDTIEAYLDGVKRLTATDSQYAGGQFGVLLHQGVAAYDNLAAWGLP